MCPELKLLMMIWKDDDDDDRHHYLHCAGDAKSTISKNMAITNTGLA